MISFTLGPFSCVDHSGVLTIQLGILTMCQHEHEPATEQELHSFASQFLGRKLSQWRKDINKDYEELKHADRLS